MSINKTTFRLKRDFWKKVFSGLITISLLVNSLLPYSVLGMVYAQESRDSKVFSKNLQKQKQDYVPGEVIVKFKREKLDVKSVIGKAQAFLFEKKFSLEKKDEIKNLNIQVFKSKKSTEQMIRELKADSNIEYVEPNYYRYPMITPNDTSYSNLWGLQNTGQTVNSTSGTSDADIDAPEAWNLETAPQTDIVIAVVDSGAAYNHPDLLGNMWDGSSSCKDENNNTISGGCPNHGWDYDKSSGSDNNPLDDNGHGTHIAGTIGAISNNSTGISGLSYQNNLKIMAVKFGYNYSTVANEIKAINFARYNNARIINASYGSSSFSQSEKDTIDAFPGLFIAAAGNAGANNEISSTYPCNYTSSNIICVAATDQNDGLASVSNYGSTSVDVGAPGVNIYSTEGYRLLLEDFESVTPPSIGSNFTQSGSNTWGTYQYPGDKVVYGDLQYPYRNNTNSYLNSGTYNLTGVTGAYIDFYYQCTAEIISYDYLTFEVYNGSGWVELDRFGSIIDNTVVYDTVTYNVSPYINSNFKFRFLWHTDGSGNYYDGCLLNDIKLVNSSSTNGSYQFMDGTSMATPHVVGLAGMLYSFEPNLTNAQAKTLILNYGDSKASLSGKTVSGKRINLYNSLSNAALPSTPVASPTGGTHYDTLYVALTSTNSTSIRYTTNSSTPTCSSTQYSSPITISATTTLKAIGCNSIGSSSVMSETYTISSPASTWYLAEGYTGGSFDTYILVQNPNGSAATVDVTFMNQGLSNVSKQYTVGANTRYTINANTENGTDKSFSTKVTSDQNIIVERAMYWDGGGISWVDGHDSQGVVQ